MSHVTHKLAESFLLFGGLLFLLAWSVGCRNEPPGKKNAHQQEQQKIAPDNKMNAVEKTSELKVASWKEVQQQVAKHRGKVVVLNIWLTTCGICLEEFPQFLKLQQRYGKENLVCLSLNGDYDGIKGKPPEQYREDIEKFLAKQTSPGEHYLLSLPFIDFMELVDLGSTPALFVYSQEGKLVKEFDNDDVKTEEEEFTYDDVIQLIDSLLKNKG